MFRRAYPAYMCRVVASMSAVARYSSTRRSTVASWSGLRPATAFASSRARTEPLRMIKKPQNAW